MGQSPSIEHPAFTPEDAIKMSYIVKKGKAGNYKGGDVTPQKSFIQDTAYYDEEDSVQYTNPIGEVNKAVQFVKDFLLVAPLSKPNDVNLDANPILVLDSDVIMAPDELEDSQIFASTRQSHTPRGYALKLRMKGIVIRTQQNAMKTSQVYKELGTDKYKRFSFASHKMDSKNKSNVAPNKSHSVESKPRLSKKLNSQEFDDPLTSGMTKETKNLYVWNGRTPQQQQQPNSRNQGSEERMPQFGNNSGYKTLDEQRREKKEKDNKNHESLVNLREEMDKLKDNYERTKSIERKPSARNMVESEFMSPRNYETPKANKKVKFEEEEREAYRTPHHTSQAFPNYEKQMSKSHYVSRESEEFPPEKLVISHNHINTDKKNAGPYQHILRSAPPQDEPKRSTSPYQHILRQDDNIRTPHTARDQNRSTSPYQHILRSTPPQDDNMARAPNTERTGRTNQPVITDFMTKRNEIRGHSPFGSTSRSRSPELNQAPNAIPYAKELNLSAHSSMLQSEKSYYYDKNDSNQKPLDSRKFISPRSQAAAQAQSQNKNQVQPQTQPQHQPQIQPQTQVQQKKHILNATPQTSAQTNYSGQNVPNQHYQNHQQGYQNYYPSHNQPVLIQNQYTNLNNSHLNNNNNNTPYMNNNNNNPHYRMAGAPVQQQYRDERPKNAHLINKDLLNRSAQDYRSDHNNSYEDEFSSPVSVNVDLQDLLNDSRSYIQQQPQQMKNERPKQQQPPQQSPQQNMYYQAPVNRHNQVDHHYKNLPNQQDNVKTPAPKQQFVQNGPIANNGQYYLPNGMAQNVKPRHMVQAQQVYNNPQQGYGNLNMHPQMQQMQQMQGREQNPVNYYAPVHVQQQMQQQKYQQQEKLNKSAMLDTSGSRGKDKNYEVRYVKNPIFQGYEKSQPPREYQDMSHMSQSVIVNNLELQNAMQPQQSNESMMKRSKWEMRNDAGFTSARDQILPPEFTNAANGYHSARRPYQ